MNTYVAPKAGYYRISSAIKTCRPTGKFETIANPDYKLFTFWRPKTITVEIYEYSTEHTGTQIVRVNGGEFLYSTRLPERL